MENDREQEVIALMHRLKTAGQSLAGIARELNDQGIPTKEGGDWRHTTVNRILKRNGNRPPTN